MFGQDDDEEENEAEKEAAAKAKAGQKPPGFVQASTTAATTVSVTTTPTKSPGAKAVLEQEGTLYIRDAKARRKKEMDDHLEAIKKYSKVVTLTLQASRAHFVMITGHGSGSVLIFNPGTMYQ